MKQKFWQDRWNNNQIGFHQPEYNPHLKKHLHQIKADQSPKILVPLCGKTKDMVFLRDQGFEVIGIEFVQEAVEAFFEENDIEAMKNKQRGLTYYEGGNIRIYCGDFFLLKGQHIEGINAVYDRASLIALSEELREKYIAHLESLMQKSVKVLQITLVYPQEQMSGPPFSVSVDYIKSGFSKCSVEELDTYDSLRATPRLAEKGLTSLEEVVLLLMKN